MMTIFSTTLNKDIDNRIGFYYWSDLVAFLRDEMEKDGCTYPEKIGYWKENRKCTKLTCSLQWTRIDKATGIAHTVTKRVICHHPEWMIESVRVFDRVVRFGVKGEERFKAYTYKHMEW